MHLCVCVCECAHLFMKWNKNIFIMRKVLMCFVYGYLCCFWICYCFWWFSHIGKLLWIMQLKTMQMKLQLYCALLIRWVSEWDSSQLNSFVFLTFIFVHIHTKLGFVIVCFKFFNLNFILFLIFLNVKFWYIFLFICKFILKK